MDVPTAIKTQLQQEGSHDHKGILLEHLAQVNREIVPLGPVGHLLHKATLVDSRST